VALIRFQLTHMLLYTDSVGLPWGSSNFSHVAADNSLQRRSKHDPRLPDEPGRLERPYVPAVVVCCVHQAVRQSPWRSALTGLPRRSSACNGHEKHQHIVWACNVAN
jgi:hypothetical protein